MYHINIVLNWVASALQVPCFQYMHPDGVYALRHVATSLNAELTFAVRYRQFTQEGPDRYSLPFLGRRRTQARGSVGNGFHKQTIDMWGSARSRSYRAGAGLFPVKGSPLLSCRTVSSANHSEDDSCVCGVPLDWATRRYLTTLDCWCVYHRGLGKFSRRRLLSRQIHRQSGSVSWVAGKI